MMRLVNRLRRPLLMPAAAMPSAMAAQLTAPIAVPPAISRADVGAEAAGLVGCEPEKSLVWPVPPVALVPHLVLPQVIDRRCTRVYVDVRYAGSALFLTWLEDARRMGATVTVEAVSAQELAVHRTAQALTDANSVPEDADENTLNFARQLFTDLAAIRASDLTILVREHHAELQARVKGDVKTIANRSMRREEGEALVRAIYTGLASVRQATYNPREFQDARISGDALPGTGLSSIRILRGPAHPVEAGGGFMAARLQYADVSRLADRSSVPSSVPITRRLRLRTPKRPAGEFLLGQMGFTPDQAELLERLMRRPMGIIVVTGPTGSGKTTTLYECTRQQARLFPHRRMVTIEDPPEYPMDEAIQLATESALFAHRLRMALRMDPNSIMYGEVRGAEEAVAALQAAMTGHLVWTTAHVADPFETIARFETMDHVRLARAVTCHHRLIAGLIAQRRVPLLCPHCSRPFAEVEPQKPAWMVGALRSWGDLSRVRVRGDGCEHCNGEAITGEQAVAEIVLTDEALMEDFIEQGSAVAARNHRAKPGADRTMIDHAMDLVLAGRLDPDDAQSEVDEIPFRDPGLTQDGVREVCA
jgi:type II secretory ATPase GspE/PulE/Tfp pilus assembly ATPase PilB-like protein